MIPSYCEGFLFTFVFIVMIYVITESQMKHIVKEGSGSNGMKKLIFKMLDDELLISETKDHFTFYTHDESIVIRYFKDNLKVIFLTEYFDKFFYPFSLEKDQYEPILKEWVESSVSW